VRDWGENLHPARSFGGLRNFALPRFTGLANAARRRTLKRDEHGARFFLLSRNEVLGLRSGALTNRNHLAMTKLGTSVAILATVCCFSARAQTISVMVLDQAGAQTVLQAAKESAQQRNAPSAIAVVDPAGDLLAFQRMDGVRPASAELAIEKARTAARLQRPTAEIEDNINRGRTAFVTAGIAALRGGMPILVNDEVVGAVGVAGLSMENDTGIANTAAAALNPLPETAQRK
jgi:glc operon protein GlcG